MKMWFAFAGSLIVGLVPANGAPQEIRLQMKPANFDRPPCQAVFQLQKETVPTDSTSIFVKDVESGTEVPARFSKEESVVRWRIDRTIPAGEKPHFVLSWRQSDQSEKSDTKSAVEIETTAARIVARKNDRPVFQYNIQPTEEAARHEPHYTRTGYLHPVYAPSGLEVTGDYAADHKHQHGLFFAWTKSSFKGKPCEFWNESAKRGKVRHRGSPMINGLVLSTEQEFVQFTKSGERIVLVEQWEIALHDNVTTDYFVFDLSSKQSCASDAPLTVHKYHYGGMAIRGNVQWLSEKKDDSPPGKMITSESKTRENGNHSRPRWTAMYGPVGGKICGVAVLAHPQNFRFPQWVRLHPSKPYFVYAPMVEEPFDIVPGAPYTSRFRYLVFDGEPDVDQIEAVWNDFARPAGFTVAK